MIKTIQHQCFANPSINFSIYLNHKIQFNYHGTNGISRLESLLNHWTPSWQKFLTTHGITVDLILNYQKKGKFFMALNHRPIEDFKIKHFIKKQLEKHGAKPELSGGLFLTMEPNEVDINIHPRKFQVKFRNSNEVYGAIKATIESAFQNQDSTIIGSGEKTLGNNLFNKPMNLGQSMNLLKESTKKPLDIMKLQELNKENHKIPYIDNNLSIDKVHSVESDKVSESFQKNYGYFSILDEKFLWVAKDHEIIMVRTKFLKTTVTKPLESKIITLPPELLSQSARWHNYGIKFSLISENTIIAWEIPSSYPKDLIEFFKELEGQWRDNQGEIWLNQWQPFNDDYIIETILDNPWNPQWPWVEYSWKIDK
jgi:hypothetical protein